MDVESDESWRRCLAGRLKFIDLIVKVINGGGNCASLVPPGLSLTYPCGRDFSECFVYLYYIDQKAF